MWDRDSLQGPCAFHTNHKAAYDGEQNQPIPLGLLTTPAGIHHLQHLDWGPKRKGSCQTRAYTQQHGASLITERVQITNQQSFGKVY